MTRITPRTCLWPLAGSLVLTFGLSIGLTFRSNHHCYAGTCGETLFPLQARLHVGIWYSWLAISVAILAIRAFHPSMQKILRVPLSERRLPLLEKHMGVGGLLLALWILALYGAIIGVWWLRLRDYFTHRGVEGGVLSGNRRLAAIALTGHFCDVTMGMAIIPISRHSALASFFEISSATTLAFHKVTAYTLFALVLIHGFLYVSWIPVFEGLSAQLRMVYPVLNPTYLYRETWPGSTSSLGIWRSSLIFTGIATSSIMLAIFITTLPIIRKRHFNVFYFTHLLGIVAIIIICLHASTMFYCTSPGLMMWLLDWVMRLCELWAPREGSIRELGKGWYSISVPLSRRRLDGCACTSPLAHFFIYHLESSMKELHPFTTTTHLASEKTATHHTEEDINIEFIFRAQGTHTKRYIRVNEEKRGFGSTVSDLVRRLGSRESRPQWTDRLASFAPDDSIPKDTSLESATSSRRPSQAPQVQISLRLEGPYFTSADPARYRTVVCFVAGTGVSGALAIAAAFKEQGQQSACACAAPSGEHDQQRGSVGSSLEMEADPGSRQSMVLVSKNNVWTRCIVIWSVREDTYIDLPGLNGSPGSGLETRIHLTGNGRKRLSVGDSLDGIIREDTANALTPASIWVYISGPNAFIDAGEAACKQRQHQGVHWYGAK